MKKNVKTMLSCAAVAAVMSVSGLCSVTAFADWHTTSSGAYYYTNESGKKVTGWTTIDGEKYCFSKKGYAATGFMSFGNKTFYFIKTKKGQMATGWQKIGKDMYYFGNNGVMRTGWRNIDGKRYYFQSDGKMATGKVKIDGKEYTFRNDGVYAGSGSSASSAASTAAVSTTELVSNIKLGMNSSQIETLVKKNGFKNKYVKFDLESGARVSGIIDAEVYGVSNCTVSFMFDKNDSLICVEIMSSASGSFDLFNAAIKGSYPISTEVETNGMTSIVYMTDVNENATVAMLTNSQNGAILRITQNQYLQQVGDIYEEFYSQIST